MPIIHHPDVRRMLLTMRRQIEAMRGARLSTPRSASIARGAIPTRRRAPRSQARVDLLTPIVKAWCTDLGVEIASLGVQVHGGMGFIEETGAAQHLRDARILPIYEGTNGIQANDLVGRKLARDGGAAAAAFIADGETLAERLAAASGDDAAAIARQLRLGLAALRTATEMLVTRLSEAPRIAAAGASPYMRLFGLVAGGYVMAKVALAAIEKLTQGPQDLAFLHARLVSARFYADHWLSQAPHCCTRRRGGRGNDIPGRRRDLTSPSTHRARLQDARRRKAFEPANFCLHRGGVGPKKRDAQPLSPYAATVGG